MYMRVFIQNSHDAIYQSKTESKMWPNAYLWSSENAEKNSEILE